MFGELITGVNSLIQGSKQRREARGINPVDVTYTESPYAKMQLAQAEQVLNGRAAGAAAAENNIYKNQSNSFLNIARVANPSQIIAAAGILQSSTNSALNQLAAKEQEQKQLLYGNFNNALQVMTGEADKVYADNLRKYNTAYNYKQQLLNSASQNTQNGLAGLGGYMDGVAQFAMNLIAPGSGMALQKTPAAVSNAGNYASPTTSWLPQTAPSNVTIAPYRG